MEGRDAAFGGALESIMKNVEQQELDEAKDAKKVSDPLKAAKPADLSKEGEKDQKLHQLDSMGADVKPHPKESKAEEGIEPEHDKDAEDTMIQKLTEDIAKLTEAEAGLSADLKALIGKAKAALDGGEYDAARGYCDRLEQVQVAVREPEKEAEEPPMAEPPVVEPPMAEPPMEEPEMPLENKDESEEPVEESDDPEKKEDEVPLA